MRDTMKTLLLLLLLTTSAAAQQAYVGYDGARLYAEASYLADVIDTLTRGDTVATFEKEKKFVRVTVAGREGWILAANLVATAPANRPATRSSSKKTPPGATATGTAPKSSANDATSGARGGATGSTPATAPCAATTRSGKQCSRAATEGSSYCWQHRK